MQNIEPAQPVQVFDVDADTDDRVYDERPHRSGCTWAALAPLLGLVRR